MGRSTHMRQSVEGTLRNWSDRLWVGVCSDENGNILTPREVKAVFLQAREEGKVVLPICHAHECPDFDYSGGGCPGHFKLYADEAIQLAKDKGLTHFIQTGPDKWQFDTAIRLNQPFDMAWGMNAPQLKQAVQEALDADADFPELDAEASLSCQNHPS